MYGQNIAMQAEMPDYETSDVKSSPLQFALESLDQALEKHSYMVEAIQKKTHPLRWASPITVSDKASPPKEDNSSPVVTHLNNLVRTISRLTQDLSYTIESLEI